MSFKFSVTPQAPYMAEAMESNILSSRLRVVEMKPRIMKKVGGEFADNQKIAKKLDGETKNHIYFLIIT